MGTLAEDMMERQAEYEWGMYEKEKEEKKKKTIKPIKERFKQFLKETDLPRRRSEENDALEIAYKLVTEGVLSKETIRINHENTLNELERERAKGKEKAEKYEARIKNTICPGFFSASRDFKSEESIEEELNTFLSESDIEIRMSDEDKIKELAREMYKDDVSSKDVIESLYKKKVEEASNNRDRELRKFKGCTEQISKGKFKDFFAKVLK